MKNAWVDENVRDLYRAFGKGRKVGGTGAAVQDEEGVEVFSAVEGTGTGTGRRDLRCVLVSQLLAVLSFGRGRVYGGKWY